MISCLLTHPLQILAISACTLAQNSNYYIYFEVNSFDFLFSLRSSRLLLVFYTKKA